MIPALRRQILSTSLRNHKGLKPTSSRFDLDGIVARTSSSSSSSSFPPDRRQRRGGGIRRERQTSRQQDRASKQAIYEEVRHVVQRSRNEAHKSRKTHKAPTTTGMSSVGRILSVARQAAASYEEDRAPFGDSNQSNNNTGDSSKQVKGDAGDDLLVVTTPENAYSDVIQKAVSGKKFRREHTAKPIPHELSDPVIEYLRRPEPLFEDTAGQLIPTIERALQRDSDGEAAAELKKQLLKDLTEQRERFMARTGWNDKQYQMFQGAMLKAGNICARNGLGQPVELLWLKIREAAIVDKNLLQTVLHVASTFSPGNRRKRALYGKYSGASIMHILEGASTEMDPSEVEDEDLTDIVDEMAVYHDLRFEPTEQSLLVRSRLLIAQGRARDAEDLLTAHSARTALHLRSFLPVLRMYLERGELGSALRVYRKMREISPVQLDAETYVQLIASMAEHGGFRPSAPPIENVHSLGFQAASGPQLLDELVAEMKEEIIEIPSALARRLHNAFAEGFPDSGLEKLTSLAPLKTSEEPVQSHELVLADLVPIDPFTGQCRRSGVTLRLEHLADPDILQLKNGIMELASDRRNQFLDGRDKGRSTDRRGDAVEHLNSFFRWLDRREGEPYTVIIDGSNVAYYMQNFETGRFSYHQIEFVMDALEKAGEYPLVVLPRKYTLDLFSVSVGTNSGTSSWKQRLTSAEKRIRNKLMDSDNIAVVPPGFLDDYYWILASVSKQTTSRNGRDLTVPPDDPSLRWPGTRPVLMTNDQMRDHKLGMLEPMIFRRWYSNYIVNYNFPAFVGSECSHPEIGFSPADFFSREIQRNQTSDGDNAWHFPISDMQDVWFCLSVRSEE